MTDTYADAQAVLVLHTWTQSQDIQSQNYLEISMRIFCSGWFRRLWCLQEGALARTVFFQFRDVAWKLALPPPAEDEQPDFWGFWSFVQTNWADLKGFFGTDDFKSQLFRLIRSLEWRSTSVDSDEALCVSALLGRDLYDIARTPPEQRMTKLWSKSQWYPPEIFLYTGRRLEQRGFRWAPATFRNPSLIGFNFRNDGRKVITIAPNEGGIDLDHSLLVAIEREVEDILYVRSLTSVDITRVSKESEHLLGCGLGTHQTDLRTFDLMLGQKRKNDQKWCVD
ncbi:MAG: hypothetical protein M1836_001099 [Candelina mexicana]|nr:MAG: hypothetical protein M1836_001099 [Candelina mexicana]